jgi:hypothetical protein
MTKLSEVGRLHGRATAVVQGLTARLEEGNLVHTAEGVRFAPSPPAPPPPPGGGPAPEPAPTPVHVIVGNALVASFEPGEVDEAAVLVRDINGALASVRDAYEAKYSGLIVGLLAA